VRSLRPYSWIFPHRLASRSPTPFLKPKAVTTVALRYYRRDLSIFWQAPSEMAFSPSVPIKVASPLRLSPHPVFPVALCGKTPSPDLCLFRKIFFPPLRGRIRYLSYWIIFETQYPERNPMTANAREESTPNLFPQGFPRCSITFYNYQRLTSPFETCSLCSRCRFQSGRS